MLVCRHEWELAKSYLEFIAKLGMHLFEDWMEHATRRAFKVSKLFQTHRRIRWSKHMRRLSAWHAGNNGLRLRR